MKYYSEITKNLYDSIEALEEAEMKVKQAEEAARKAKEEEEMKAKVIKAERAEAAKEVEEAFRNYNRLLNDFCRKYGPFHMTFTNEDFNDIFKLF